MMHVTSIENVVVKYSKRMEARQQTVLTLLTKEAFKESFQTQATVAMVGQQSRTTQICSQR